MELDNFRVGLTPTVFCIPGFITDEQQTQLLNHIYGASGSKWKTLKNRRLQNWGGMVHEKGLVPQEYFLHGISDSPTHCYNQVVNEAEALAYSNSRKDADKILHRDQTRVSLTCRLVPKVHKNLFRL
ncbi:PREDICTED: uncharacterized protein LOC104718279 [Camelina sativa]|uniref:Uncharacterized protein LOC104718279 n=1 Tax=Camelina sativa TaxID=90675 RepID=A0ABM0U131_CAMSA|nr:PREDICTED: uncharacterized protein LOC104718279 [Camelina sativa]